MTTKSRSRISIMRRSANHLAGLIDGLLDISKIEAGKLELSRDLVDIRSFLTQVVDMFSIQAEKKGIRFVTDIPSDLPATVTADERRLRQVLINLLSNAIKFTRQGNVCLRVNYRNEVAIFSIEDTGPGIAPDDLERIFHPFERLRASAGEPGTGLGLTICRLLAGVMGGEISVKSNVGAGTTFRFRLFLPRYLGERQILRTPPAVDDSFGSGKMIFIIDDDPTHRAMVSEALSPYGFDLFYAEDGAQALEMSASLQPDLFLIDIEMPGINGWELAQSLRSVGHLGAKIVMVSASAIEMPKSGSDIVFHDAFVAKPVDMDLLVETIANLVEPSRRDQKTIISSCGVAGSALRNPGDDVIQTLLEHAEVGHIRGLKDELALVQSRDEGNEAFVDYMLSFVDSMDMARLIGALERVRTSSR